MAVLDRYRSIVDDFAAFEAACDRPLPRVVRVNTVKATVSGVRRALTEAGIAHEQTDWHEGLFRLPEDAPGTNWPYVHGWIYGQEEVSVLPGLVLDPEPGDRVWDACAAPGSKTTHLAALMDDEGELVATDANRGRLSALRSHTERLGLTCVAVTNEDARNHSLKPFGGAEYDAALVDAPCSCEGTIRKNPDALERWTRDHVEHCASLQQAILERAIQVTRPGGTVVYSTCTFAPEENEAVLEYALETAPCRMAEVDLPLESRPGVTTWETDEGSLTFDPAVARARRVYPHLNDTGGFFCAALEVTG